MREVFLGEYIKQRRLELGLTQEQLCEGICEPITISRMENGRQTPSRNRINALLQRLGLPDDRYVALLSKNEEEISALQKEITACCIQGPTSRGWELLEDLGRIMEPDDRITQQFILSSKVVLGKAEGRYSAEEQLSMLTEALRLTVPRFDLEEIGRGLYCFDEVKIINQIAGVYSNNGQNRKTIAILEQLLKYIRKHYQNILQSGGLFLLVSHNYARTLSVSKRYEEAIEIAEAGRQSCIKYGHYQFLPGLLAIMAECYHFIGDIEKSKERYCQAYALYSALDKRKNLAQLIKEINAYYPEGLVFQLNTSS